MSGSIVARSQGDDYQARVFWREACQLFHDHTKVLRVGYEANNVKSLDDVAVFYDAGMTDEYDDPLSADYFQVKFHVSAAGACTWEGMMDPAFINAASVSLLQRLRNAQQQYAPDGRGSRFYLYSPWGIHPDDPLAAVLSAADGRLLWSKLSVGGPRSELGKIRAAWCRHLGIAGDAELEVVLRPLRLETGQTLHRLGKDLNASLRNAGFKPIPAARLWPFVMPHAA